MRGADTIAELPDIGWTFRIAAILRGLLATTLCLILGGCAYGGPASSSTTMTTPPSAAATNLPVRAEDKDDHFHLVFELPKATWRTTEAINGQATLSLVGTRSKNVSDSGSGILGFEFAEVGGDRKVSWVREADCGPRQLDAADPIVLPVTKTAGYGADAPAADFYRSFATDPLVHLSAGDWTIAAVTWFSESQDCSGLVHQMSASVLVHVQS